MKRKVISLVCAIAMAFSVVGPVFTACAEDAATVTDVAAAVAAATEAAAAKAAATEAAVAEQPLDEAPSYPSMVIPDNATILIEGENITNIREGVETSVKGSFSTSGGKYFYMGATESVTEKPDAAAEPDFRINLKSEFPEGYILWARVSERTSFWYSINGEDYKKVSNVSSSGNKWVWKELGRYSVMGDSLEIRFIHGLVNTEIDRIVVTDDISFTPVNANDIPEYDTTKFYNMPTHNPPEGHPRVYITKEKLPEIQQLARTERFAHIIPSLQRTSADFTLEDCKREGIGDTNAEIHTFLRSRAFLYLLGGADEEFGKETIKMARTYFESADWEGKSTDARSMGEAIWSVSLVYDYIFDLLTEEDKHAIIARAKYFYSKIECKYPISQTLGKMFGHTNEYMIFRDMLAPGAAFYDEDPEIWNIAAGCFFQYLAPGKYWQSQGGVHGSGTMYGTGVRLMGETYAMMLFMTWGLTEEQLFSDNWKNLAIKFEYMRLPTGTIIHDGEKGPRSDPPLWRHISPLERISTMFPESPYHPYLRGQYIKYATAIGYSTDMDVWDLLFWHPETDEGYDVIDFGSNMPLSFLGGFPFTHVCARTGWNLGIDSPDAIALMKGRNYSVENHMKPDNGGFELYYKGELATSTIVNSGGSGFTVSAADRQYDRRTISHNCITVTDPEEFFSNTFYAPERDQIVYNNDGGQDLEVLFNSRHGDTLEQTLELCGPIAVTQGKYAGPNTKTPKFTYLKSDLTKSYAGRRVHKEDGRTLPQVLREDYGYKIVPEEVIKRDHFYPMYKEDYYVVPKLKDYRRSMVFVDLDNKDYPAAFICFDSVESVNKDFEKKWLLHAVDSMTVEGNITTITNTQTTNGSDKYNGKLVNYTLLPENPKMELIGGEGKEAWVAGKNWTGPKKLANTLNKTNWRLEVSPNAPAEKDLFLNAMYVTDYDRNLPQLPMYKEDSATHLGVTVLDRVVMFAKEANPVAAAFDMSIRDNNNGGVMSCMITDVAPGKWIVTGGGKNQVVEVTEEENTLYFEGVPGEYSFAPADASAKVDEIAYPELYKTPMGDMIIFGSDGMFRYNPVPPRIIDGVPYVGAESFLSYYDGTSITNNGDGSYTIKTQMTFDNNMGIDKSAVIWPDKNEMILNGKPATVENAPKMIDGVLYIDPREYTGATCLEYTWKPRDKALVVNDRGPIEAMFAAHGCKFENVLPYEITSFSSYDALHPDGMKDFNMDSRWTSTTTDDKAEWIIMDFGAEYDLDAIFMSSYRGNRRREKFAIEVSNDMENWTEVFRGESSGKTESIEKFDITGDATGVRYVRGLFFGNSTNGYNSINEFWISKKPQE